MPYSMKWGAGHPGCVIFLLDWSGSMEGVFTAGQIGAGQRKADTLPNVLNNALNGLKERCVKGDIISHRADVAAIGYESTAGSIFHEYPHGNPLRGRDLIPIPELALHPLHVDKRNDVEITATGKRLEVPVDFPVWVKPEVRGMTSMCAALKLARDIAERWINDKHMHCFPPIVVNITDGAASDGDPRPDAERLRSLQTNDGNLLLFNCHLSTDGSGKVMFPSLGEPLNTADQFAPMLLEMSSELPPVMRAYAIEQGIKPNMKEGDRAFIFNGDADSIFKMIQMGTEIKQADTEADGGAR